MTDNIVEDRTRRLEEAAVRLTDMYCSTDNEVCDYWASLPMDATRRLCRAHELLAELGIDGGRGR